MNACKYALLAALGAVALAGCGERPQVTHYQQGRYQGKPDDLAWDNERFNHDRTTWENAIKSWQQHQNEYQRMR